MLRHIVSWFRALSIDRQIELFAAGLLFMLVAFIVGLIAFSTVT